MNLPELIAVRDEFTFRNRFTVAYFIQFIMTLGYLHPPVLYRHHQNLQKGLLKSVSVTGIY